MNLSFQSVFFFAMSLFQLTITFSDADLDTLHQSGESVVLIKTSSTPGDTTAAIWATFKPFSINTITWVENYSVYASAVTPVQGGILSQLAVTSAIGGQSYSFMPAGHFQGPNAPVGLAAGIGSNQNASLSNNQYQVLNATDGNFLMPAVTFGLAQDVTINGVGLLARPLNAMSVPTGQNATFTPLTNLLVYTESSVTAGSVLEDLRSDITPLTFGNVSNAPLNLPISTAIRYSGGRFMQSA